ncbi:MAG: type II secretion system protein [bacterium]|nr:type II secretion system protein [bacterium]
MKNRKGSTLIELLVVVAIISIMTAVTIVSLQGGKTEKELEIAAREMVADIREAQNNALTGKNASSTCIEYHFLYTNKGKVYYTGGWPCPNIVRNIYIDKKIMIKVPNPIGPFGFSFSIPFGTIGNFQPPLSGPSDVYSVELTKNSKSYFICVTQAGSVYEKKDGCT